MGNTTSETEKKWRDDGISPRGAGPVDICAEDEIARVGGRVIVVVHVRGFHGRGFMSSVRSSGSTSNGAIVYGEDGGAHNRAENEGRRDLGKLVARELDYAVNGVARAVNEIRGEVQIRESGWDLQAVMPSGAWRQIEEALDEWQEATAAVLAAAGITDPCGCSDCPPKPRTT